MAIQALIPYALAAYGGYKGYQGAKDSGASGLGRILGGLTGAYTGYTLGSTGMSMFPQSAATKAFAASQPAFLANMPGAYNPQNSALTSRTMSAVPGGGDPTMFARTQQQQSGSGILDILRKGGESGAEFSPGRV